MNYSPKYFFLIFISILLLLFFVELLSITQQMIIIPWTEFLASISSGMVSFFDSNAIAHGIILQDSKSGFAVSIQPGCNGIEAAIVLIAAITAYPSTLLQKIGGIIIGFLAIQALNVIRIISLFYLGQWNITLFEWAHLYIWQALIMLDVFIVFILWVKYMQAKKAKQSANHEITAENKQNASQETKD
ncbi:MAG: exosortase H [Pseudomonadota bacterium]